MTDTCDSPELLSVEEAINKMIEAIKLTKRTKDSVALGNSINRIIATDIISKLDVPSHDNSAMDGYALIASDLLKTDTLTEVGILYAGNTYEPEIHSGQCIRIMTGAQIPKGANTVIMKEQTKTLENKKVKFLVKKPAGNDIRKAGENISNGSLVVKQGTRLNASKIALLASLGEKNVLVYKKLTIGILATGNELVLAGEPLASGQIYESNRIALIALLSQFGAEIIDYGIIKDELSPIREVLIKADKECDLVISSGGVSVGDADFVKEVLNEIGKVNFWKVAIKPGKPFAFGRLSKALFCGLPGNPVSSFVTCQQLVFPLLGQLQNELPVGSKTFAAKLTQDVRKKEGRMDFQRGLYHLDEQGNIFAEPNGQQGSGIMSSIANANCYIVIPAKRGNLKKGETVKIMPFEHLYS